MTLIRNTILIFAICTTTLFIGYRRFGLLGLMGGLILIILLFLLMAVVVTRLILRRRGGFLTNVGPETGTYEERDAKSRTFIAEKEALLAPLGWEDVTITSKDGLALHGYFIAGNATEKRTVILLHGYGWRALQMAEYALFWHNTYGVNVLMPDARAHGESEGLYTTMGYHEKADVHLWMTWLTQRFGEEAPVALHGISMGATTALAAAGTAPPPQLRFVVSDCAFTDAYQEFSHQISTLFHQPPIPLLPLLAVSVRFAAGFWLWHASATTYVAKITTPTLFVHGECDNYVPTRMVYPLYQGAKSDDKQLLLVPGAKHVRAFFDDESGRYKEELSRLVETYL